MLHTLSLEGKVFTFFFFGGGGGVGRDKMRLVNFIYQIFLILCIFETPKQVLCQTVKTQMNASLFVKTKQSSEKDSILAGNYNL